MRNYVEVEVSTDIDLLLLYFRHFLLLLGSLAFGRFEAFAEGDEVFLELVDFFTEVRQSA